MNKKIKVKLTPRSIGDFIKTLKSYEKWLNKKRDEICEKLAMYGVTSASIKFARSIYTGDKDFKVTLKKIDNGYKVLANGESVLFIEFGAGAKYGYGHPDVQEYGPGTYPGAGHWDDPNGWWFPTNNPNFIKHIDRDGQGWGHSYGNVPNAPMYNTLKELEEQLPHIIKEVFSRD